MKTYKRNFQVPVVFTALISLLVVSGCEMPWTKKEEPKLLVVNVLNRDLYDDCHIPGSIHVDFMDVMDKAKEWSKSTKIVIYCANYACTASSSAVRSLKNEGFDAYEYGAGMAGWFQAGYPVVGQAQSPYLHQANEPHAESAQDLPTISTEALKKLLDASGLQQA